jgi:hypothetical protein
MAWGKSYQRITRIYDPLVNNFLSNRRSRIVCPSLLSQSEIGWVREETNTRVRVERYPTHGKIENGHPVSLWSVSFSLAGDEARLCRHFSPSHTNDAKSVYYNHNKRHICDFKRMQGCVIHSRQVYSFILSYVKKKRSMNILPGEDPPYFESEAR